MSTCFLHHLRSGCISWFSLYVGCRERGVNWEESCDRFIPSLSRENEIATLKYRPSNSRCWALFIQSLILYIHTLIQPTTLINAITYALIFSAFNSTYSSLYTSTMILKAFLFYLYPDHNVSVCIFHPFSFLSISFIHRLHSFFFPDLLSWQNWFSPCRLMSWRAVLRKEKRSCLNSE